MLDRCHRLRGNDLFQRIFLHGKRRFVGEVALFSLVQKDATLKVGVTFKQKAFPKAVTRHRYKRQTLGWVSQHLDAFPSGRVYVIHFQRPFPRGDEKRALPETLTQLTQKPL